ncbi:hypothetical protein APF79_05115 [bacterium BRH_c32]|nr:MAG: hypothetical protein APF79_05115 [bacterium BRH_c32]
MIFQAESLNEFVNKTIDEEILEELTLLKNYDKTKILIQGIIDIPNCQIDLFSRLVLQNNGSLSNNKRTSHFDFLTDEELQEMELAVKEGYKLPE